MATDPIESALAPVAQAQRMLAQASTFEDFRDIRDLSETARAYARARGLGIESENMASEYVLRAERGMGKVLIEMMESGQRAPSHPVSADKAALVPKLTELIGETNDSRARREASNWQRLYRAWTDEEFEGQLARVKELGARIAKTNFYRGFEKSAARDKAAIREAADAASPDESTTEVSALVRAAEAVESVMSQLPADELLVVATTIQGLVASYNAVRASRS